MQGGNLQQSKLSEVFHNLVVVENGELRIVLSVKDMHRDLLDMYIHDAQLEPDHHCVIKLTRRLNQGRISVDALRILKTK